VSDATANSKLVLTGVHRLVRFVGAVFLSSCAVMLVLGLTVLADRLRGPAYIRYWSWCFLLTLIAIGFAGVDMLLIRRASRHARREVFREQLGSLNQHRP
jgi:hypothetical protein